MPKPSNRNPQIADERLALVDRETGEIIQGATYAPDEIEDDPTLKVLAELGAAGHGAHVNVYREAVRPGGPEAFLGKWAAAEFTLEDLKARYGGGTFRVRGYRPRREGESGPNNMRLFVNERVLIEQAKDDLPSLAVTPRNDPDMLGAIRLMIEANNENTRRILEAMAASRAAPISEDAILDKLAKYKTLFGGNDGGFSPDRMIGFLTSVVGAATGMKELVGDSAGKETNELDILGKAIDKFGEPIAEAIANFAGKPRAALPAPTGATVRPPNTHPAQSPQHHIQPQPQPQQPEEDVNIIFRTMVAGHLKTLCAKAAAQGDPVLYAELIVDEVPEDKLQELLGVPDWFDKLCAIEPNVRNYPAWFGELAGEVTAILQAPPEDDISGTDTPATDGAPAQDVPKQD
jgi:hypothetical protein